MTSQLIKMKFESYWVTKLLFDDYYLDFFIDLYKFLHFSDHKSLTLFILMDFPIHIHTKVYGTAHCVL